MTDFPLTLTLLHTNDLHSHFVETSRIASYIERIRQGVSSEKLLLVDCGDFLDRARLETEGTQGAANRTVLETIGYDAVLIGNNEGLSYTTEELDILFRDMPIPIVCANMTLSKSRQCPSWMVPTLMLEKSGIRIGLIGLTAPFNEYYELLGWNAADPMDTVKLEVERMRREVDVIIVLSHLGLRQDERMAASVEGIDLILGGHTHHLLEVPLLIEGTVIGAAGKFGSHIGHLELTFETGNKLVKISGGCIPTDEFPRHAAVDSLMDSYRTVAKQRMSRKVATVTEPLDWQSELESPLANLLACAVRNSTSAEIGLVNAGQLLQGLPEGEVSEETIHAICPSPINLCLIKLRGSRIIRALEESLLPEFHELHIRGYGFRGRVLGTICLDGAEVTVDPSRAPYDRITHVQVNGEPLIEDRLYSVGTLDMFTFGVGYLSLKEGQVMRYFVPEFIRDVLSQALNQEAWIKDCRRLRWRFQTE
jgi:5'-nucleotidase